MLFNHWNIPDQLNLTNIPFSSIVLCNRISTIPAVLLLKPNIAGLTIPTPAWLTLASSSTLPGNLTLLGSIGYLIVVEIAAHKKIYLLETQKSRNSTYNFLKCGSFYLDEFIHLVNFPNNSCFFQ